MIDSTWFNRGHYGRQCGLKGDGIKDWIWFRGGGGGGGLSGGGGGGGWSGLRKNVMKDGYVDDLFNRIYTETRNKKNTFTSQSLKRKHVIHSSRRPGFESW